MCSTTGCVLARSFLARVEHYGEGVATNQAPKRPHKHEDDTMCSGPVIGALNSKRVTQALNFLIPLFYGIIPKTKGFEIYKEGTTSEPKAPRIAVAELSACGEGFWRQSYFLDFRACGVSFGFSDSRGSIFSYLILSSGLYLPLASCKGSIDAQRVETEAIDQVHRSGFINPTLTPEPQSPKPNFPQLGPPNPPGRRPPPIRV